MITKITSVKLGHMHKGCEDPECPACANTAQWSQMSLSERRAWVESVADWMQKRGLNVVGHGLTSPWWHVDNASKYCYAKLK